MFTFVNGCDMRWVAQLQKLFMAAKVLALGLIVATGCTVYFIQGEARGFVEPFAETSTDPSLISLSFYSGLFSYAGW